MKKVHILRKTEPLLKNIWGFHMQSEHKYKTKVKQKSLFDFFCYNFRVATLYQYQQKQNKAKKLVLSFLGLQFSRSDTILISTKPKQSKRACFDFSWGTFFA